MADPGDATQEITAPGAAGALAAGMAIWPSAAAAMVPDVQVAADRPAATLPEWPDLLADLDG